MGYALHRFLILGPNLGITARFCPFMSSCVHRFLISGPDLRIDARFSPETAQRLHRFLISYTDLRIDATENSFACSARRGNDLPRPILIFVAAKKNGSACNGRGGYEVRVRFHSSLPRRRMVPPAERHFPTAASILKFELRLRNHCRFLLGNALQCAVILDFRLKLANHCMVFPV